MTWANAHSSETPDKRPNRMDSPLSPKKAPRFQGKKLKAEPENTEAEESEEKVLAKKKSADVLRTKQETSHETTGLGREVLETEVLGPDPETANIILNAEKATEGSPEQITALKRIALVSTTLFAKLYEEGIELEEITSLEKFGSMAKKKEKEIAEAWEKMNPSEKIDFQKLLEISERASDADAKSGKSSHGSLDRELGKEWKNLINKTRATYDEVKNSSSGLIAQIGKVSKEYPIATGIAVAAGAIGLYTIFFDEEEKKSSGASDASKKEGSWMDEVFNKKTALGLGLLTVGALIGFGPEKIINALSDLCKVSTEKATIAWKHIMNGDIPQALTSLFEGSHENMPAYVDIAKKISSETQEEVKAKTIKTIAAVPYGQFMSVSGSVMGEAKSWMETQIKGTFLSGVAGFVLDTDQTKEETTIRKYLEKHKADIQKLGISPQTPLEEVLAQLTSVKLEKTAEQKEQETKSALETATAAVVLPATQLNILESVEKDKGLKGENLDKVEENIEEFTQLVEEVSQANQSWWNREMELLYAFINKVPNTEYSEQDFIQLKEELEQSGAKLASDAILGSFTEQVEALKTRIGEEEKDPAQLKEELEAFYRNYHYLKTKLENIHQERVQQEKESAQDETAFGHVIDGIAFTGNTLFGIPYSVIVKEENGKIVTALGIAAIATGAWGGIKGFSIGFGKYGGGLMGRGLRGGLQGAWGATAPLRFVTYEGIILTKQAAEYVDYLHKSLGLSRVQSGKLSIKEGIQEIEQYIHKYGHKWTGGSRIEPQDAKMGVLQKVKSWGKSHNFLNQGMLDVLGKNLEELKNLEAQGCKTWTDAIDKGFVQAAPGRIATAIKPAGSIKGLEYLGGKEFEHMTQAKRIEAMESITKNADDYLDNAIKEVNAMRASGTSEEQIKQYTDDVMAHLKKTRKEFTTIFDALNKSDMSTVDRKAFKELLKTKVAHAKGFRGLLREGKTKGKYAIVFGVANIVWEYYSLTKEQKEQHVQMEIAEMAKIIGLDTLQLVVDIMFPFGISDWYTVASGKEFITGKEVGLGHRATRFVFGTYSLASDVLAVIGGAATAEVAGAGGAAVYGSSNLIEAGLRAGGKSPQVIKAVKAMIPRIATLAKDVGGFKNLLKTLKSPATLKTIETLQKVKQTSGTVMKGILAVEVAKASYAGYQMVFDTEGEQEFEVDLGQDEESETP